MARDLPQPRRPRGAWAFVAVFAACVLGLLAGYRYAIDTTANDWYLFTVSRHTTWVLGLIGHEAALEKYTADGSSPWERWHHRALSRRGEGEDGPRITFVLKPGLQHELEARELALASLRGDTREPARVAALQEEITALRGRMAEGLADPDLRKERLGLAFTFIVVPSCGAIEVMVIFLAAVLAFPASWRHRARGVALGLPLMYLVNIVRLACLACLGALDPGGAWFNFVHEYVWQAAYVIFVVLAWMAWVELGKGRRA